MQASISPGLAAGRMGKSLACSLQVLSNSSVYMWLTFFPVPQVLEQFSQYLCFLE